MMSFRLSKDIICMRYDESCINFHAHKSIYIPLTAVCLYRYTLILYYQVSSVYQLDRLDMINTIIMMSFGRSNSLNWMRYDQSSILQLSNIRFLIYTLHQNKLFDISILCIHIILYIAIIY